MAKLGCIGLGEEHGADVTMIIPKPIPYGVYLSLSKVFFN